MTPDEIRQALREEFASLGGHLLSVYGAQAEQRREGKYSAAEIQIETLATLGGYLLENYGKPTEGATDAQ